jgi:hypothetical protein
MKGKHWGTKHSWAALLLHQAPILLLLVLSGCGEDWQAIELPEHARLSDVLVTDPYAPYEWKTLLHEAEDTYGPPQDIITKGGEGYHFSQKVYAGHFGTVHICDETHYGSGGYAARQWLELVPNELHLERVISRSYLADVEAREGAWNLRFRPADASWQLILPLDGSRLQKIVYMP